MAMQILNNSAANLALANLNKNTKSSKKSLSKVSTGLKIFDVSENASAYAISERMQAQIRSLEQSSDNINKGINIINIAEIAVDEQIQIVKKMLEIAMKSSDAACSQNDRDVLQSELSQLGDQLQDIAVTTTYNGIPLLNGLTPMSEAGGMRYFNFNASGTPTANTITNLFPESGSNTVTANNGDGVSGYGGIYSNSEYTAALNFSNARNASGSPITVEDLNGQGFSVACATCELFVSFIFDTGRPASTSEYLFDEDENGKIIAEAYVVGLKDAETLDDVYECIFKGVAKANDESKNISQPDEGSITQVSDTHNVQIRKNGDSYSISKSGSLFSEQMVIYNGIAASFDKETTYI